MLLCLSLLEGQPDQGLALLHQKGSTRLVGMN